MSNICKDQNKEIAITVFTPTYNRAYVLSRGYQSLKKQSFKNFEWVIMDDGSTDQTEELVKSWIKEGCVSIVYVKQENQGRFAAFNNSQSLWRGELMFPMDSDDYLLDEALEKVWEFWKSLGNKRSIFSGMIAYMKTNGDVILGSEFPDAVEAERISVLYDKYGMTGDKVEICRTDLLRKHQYPIYQGEKFGGDSIVYNAICDEFPEFLFRCCVSFREYLPDSITNNLLKNHLRSKNGMREHYKDSLKHEYCNKYNIIKHTIGYIAYSLLTNRKMFFILNEAPDKLLAVLLYIPANIYFLYLKNKEKSLE